MVLSIAMIHTALYVAAGVAFRAVFAGPERAVAWLYEGGADMGIFTGNRPDGPVPAQRTHSTPEIDELPRVMGEFGMSTVEVEAAISDRRSDVLEICSYSQATPVALFCQRCDTTSPGDAAYCIGCGRRIREANTGETTKL